MDNRTIRQSRGKTAFAVAGSVAFVLMGAAMRADPGTRYGGGYYEAVSLACMLVFGAFAVMGAMQLVRPARLVLEPAGLTYVGPWWRRTWPWRHVGEFVIERSSGARMIRFPVDWEAAQGSPLLGGGIRPGLPGGWMLSLGEVAAELNAARERWR